MDFPHKGPGMQKGFPAMTSSWFRWINHTNVSCAMIQPKQSKAQRNVLDISYDIFYFLLIQLCLDDAPIKARQYNNTGRLNCYSDHVSNDFPAGCRWLSQPKYFWEFLWRFCLFLCMCFCRCCCCCCCCRFYFFKSGVFQLFNTRKENWNKYCPSNCHETVIKLIDMFVPRYFIKRFH